MSIKPIGSLMMSALVGPSVEGDTTDGVILDATLRCLGRHGLERMTVGDVATEAGVGRATVFRRFETKDELVRRAFAWELARLAERFHAATDSIEDPLERTIEWIVQSVHVVRTHPVARRFVEDDAALPTLRDPQVTQILLASVGHYLDITVRPAENDFDTDTVAEMIVRFFCSVWMTPDLGTATADDAGVRRIARAMLSFLSVPQTPADDN
ncbi:MAG: TetR/AcrR family transcriptional regulator [Rhodococcus sp. (in: high G+C Gram-positive bacteria)]|uniref:TetR/AcrR family transcriptional regulator n=1 Tax=Rhodococcus sp. TaxID=1831 RepID=UPI003BB049E1